MSTPLPEERTRSRWTEVGAALAWCVTSWVRPGGTSLKWEQRAGHEHQAGGDACHEDPHPQCPYAAPPSYGETSRQHQTQTQGSGS